MSEHHGFCQLRIDGLKDTIATLTAQRDAAEKVCEAAVVLVNRSTTVEQAYMDYATGGTLSRKDLNLAIANLSNGLTNALDALTEWRRTKDA